MKYAIALIALTALPAALPASAQDAFGLMPSGTIGIGIGVKHEPRYPGSDRMSASPWITIRNDEARAQGFSIAPSLGYVGPRKPSDHTDLEGLDNISRAFEVGGRVSYTLGDVTAYATARQGLGGHSGISGETGLRYRMEATPELTLWAGIEADYGNASFNRTYFGVSADEAARSRFSEHDPGAGFNSAGVSLTARYDMNPNWALLGTAKISRLIGDAGDSPIVQERVQSSVGLGVVRNIHFGF
ncbi:MAG: MipA/OmpV family protein [Paracoccus sp. (in: a-proteobacteria)]|nr:MipA/OmpV family protein [Paracoccus sp. (in: a-proteobacteria)]